MSPPKLNHRPKTAAAGPYSGFSLEQTRFCYHLLCVPDGQAVSLEYVDDVAIHRIDDSLHLEQTKRAQSGNPASDGSEDLWKSFANWADLCAAGIDPATTRFDYYVTPIKSGKLVVTLNEAVSQESVSAVLLKVKGALNSKKGNARCVSYIEKFLQAGDVTCSCIIRNFRFVTEEDPREAIRERLRSLLPPETLDDFCAAAIGIARDMAEERLRGKSDAIIPAIEFRKRFRAFVRKHNLSGLLISRSPQPKDDKIREVVDTSPVFVRQLNVIEASNEMLVTAVSDYLKTESDKTNWADNGEIVADSLDELDGQLVRWHTIARDEIEDTQNLKNEEQRGRALYRKCAEKELPLESHPLPSHFIAGSYNRLADSRRVGWHPRYKKLFAID